jgi:hypothetical protein
MRVMINLKFKKGYRYMRDRFYPSNIQALAKIVNSTLITWPLTICHKLLVPNSSANHVYTSSVFLLFYSTRLENSTILWVESKVILLLWALPVVASYLRLLFLLLNWPAKFVIALGNETNMLQPDSSFQADTSLKASQVEKQEDELVPDYQSTLNYARTVESWDVIKGGYENYTVCRYIKQELPMPANLEEKLHHDQPWIPGHFSCAFCGKIEKISQKPTSTCTRCGSKHWIKATIVTSLLNN